MNPEAWNNLYRLLWHILKMFWSTVAICLAIMAMLRINSLVHIYSPTPKAENFYSELRPLAKGAMKYDH